MSEELSNFNPFQNLDANDVVLPRLQLVQPTSSSITDGDKHIGEWFNSTTGEFFKSLNVVIVGARATRVMFPAVYQPDNAILCSSPDAIRPSPDFVGMLVGGTNIPERCSECPFSMWTENEQTGKGVPPACSVGYLYAGLTANEKPMPFSMNLRGSAMTEAKRLNFMLMTSGVGIVIEVSSQKKAGQRGNYYIPQFKAVDKTSPELIAKATGLAKAFAAKQQEVEYSEPASGGASRPVVSEEPPVPPADGFVFGHVEETDIPF